MIRTLLWKEYREQRTTALALIVFAVGLPILVQLFVEPANAADNPFGNMAIAIIWLAGLVFGGQAFAGEQESGTQAWLDAQPAWRRSIGRTKIAFSFAVVLLIAAALCLLGSFSAWIRPMTAPVALALLLLAGLSGLGCGLVGSTIGKSTLTAIGWGIAVQLALGLAAMGIALLSRPNFQVLLVAALVAMPLPFVAALRRFNSLDRARRKSVHVSSRSHSSWRTLLWLVWRQCRMSFAVISIAGLAAAIFLPISREWPIWPALGLAFGIVAGISAFAPDRSGDSQRLLGDRRWPIGRVWLVKIVFCLMLAVIPVLMQLAVIGVRWMILSFDLATSAARWESQRNVGPFLRTDFLLLGPLYGFAVGQFLGMICRKGAVAFVLSAIVGAFIVAAWWPSTVIGGLHVWQWTIPPLLLIAATRRLAWPWATTRLAEPRSALQAVAVSALATVLTVGGVAYRTIEVPDRAAPFDVAAFEASLPTPEQNEPMLKLATILRRFRADVLDVAVGTTYDPSGNPKPAWPFGVINFAGPRIDDDPELGRKLDEFAASPLVADLRALLASLADVANLSSAAAFANDYELAHAATKLGGLLNARALQLDGRGQVREAFEFLNLSLDLGRLLQQRADSNTFLTGVFIERSALQMLKPLAESSRADLEALTETLARLVESDRAASSVPDTLKIEYLRLLPAARNGGLFPNIPAGDERNLPWIAAMAPWELSRSIDILNAMIAGFLRTAELTYPDAIDRIDPDTFKGRYWFAAWTPPRNANASAAVAKMVNLTLNSIWQDGPLGTLVLTADMSNRVTRRAAILQLALAIHERRHGKPAAALTDLVPDVLTEVPIDPYDLQPFRYRISRGEKINLAPQQWYDPTEVVPVTPAGQGIIWSVGGDMQDDGGVVSGASWWGLARYHPGRDLIFLAPLIKKP